MRPSRRPIVIATRASRLAMAQASAVAGALRQLHPKVEVQLLPLVSEGDRPNEPLGRAPQNKGRFTRSIERALLDERADVAVHSLKDLPVMQTSGLIIAAIPPRGDARDVLISQNDLPLEQLPAGAVVGTSSPRRAAQMLRIRPDLEIRPIHGAVETRLAKVHEHKQFDATVLAKAGLERSGMGEHAKRPLSTEQMLPAGGQAALAVQCRADDHVTLRRCLPLNDAMTNAAVTAEREVLDRLDADCLWPIAVFAEPADDKQLRLRARVLSNHSRACVEFDDRSDLRHLRRLCQRCAESLIDQGAMALLRAAPSAPSQAAR